MNLKGKCNLVTIYLFSNRRIRNSWRSARKPLNRKRRLVTIAILAHGVRGDWAKMKAGLMCSVRRWWKIIHFYKITWSYVQTATSTMWSEHGNSKSWIGMTCWVFLASWRVGRNWGQELGTKLAWWRGKEGQGSQLSHLPPQNIYWD